MRPPKKRRQRSPGRQGGRALQPFRNPTTKPRRNSKCGCGSGLKYKACCGKPLPVSQFAYRTLRDQYTPEQQEAERKFVRQWGFNPSPAQLQLFMDGDEESLVQIVTSGMERIGTQDKFIHAVRTLKRLVTPKNQKLIPKESLEEWEKAVADEPTGDTSV